MVNLVGFSAVCHTIHAIICITSNWRVAPEGHCSLCVLSVVWAIKIDARALLQCIRESRRRRIPAQPCNVFVKVALDRTTLKARRS